MADGIDAGSARKVLEVAFDAETLIEGFEGELRENYFGLLLSLVGWMGCHSDGLLS
jgi:hypothetical protein